MALPVNDWIKSKETQRVLNLSVNELVTRDFFRDPLRRIYQNPDVMYSPADGVVLYAYNCIGPNEPVVEVKGKNFTVRQIINDPTYNHNSLVVGIFMTAADVHVNRMPTNGYLVEERDTPFIYTHNISMYALEYEFFNQLGYDKNNLNYLFCNERKVSAVMSKEIRGEYYLVQVADKDINCIINWGDGNQMHQGERFGQIRWGSQCDLVIPLRDNGLKYEITTEALMHVEAGIDKIVKIIR